MLLTKFISLFIMATGKALISKIKYLTLNLNFFNNSWLINSTVQTSNSYNVLTHFPRSLASA
jgi:hypothetical protein